MAWVELECVVCRTEFKGTKGGEWNRCHKCGTTYVPREGRDWSSIEVRDSPVLSPEELQQANQYLRRRESRQERRPFHYNPDHE